MAEPLVPDGTRGLAPDGTRGPIPAAARGPALGIARGLAYAGLACAAAAGALWYAFPQAGPWPLVLALAPWAGRWVLEGQLGCRTALDLPLLLFLLSAGVSVWAAYDRALAWPKFWLIVGGVLLFYALVNVLSSGEERIRFEGPFWLLALFGAVVAAYFLISHDWQIYPAKIDAFTRLGRALQAPLPAFPGHRLHPNVAGGIMAMLLPYAGWAALRGWRGVRRGPQPATVVRWLALLVGLGALALTAFALLLTTARGAWLGLAAALLLAGLWALSGWLSRGLGHIASAQGAASRWTGWLFVGLLVAALALALAAGLAWPGGLGALVDALPGPDTGPGRLDLLRNSLILVRDYALVGAGLGGFQMLYSTYVLLTHVGFTIHSHNLFLDVAVEQGLLALLALLWMVLLFAVTTWRCLLGFGARREAVGLGVAALSLTVLLVHGLVDDVLYGSRAVLLLFIPLAFAAPCRPTGCGLFCRVATRRPGRKGLVALPVAIVLSMFLAFLWREPVLAMLLANLGAVGQGQAELGTYAWPAWPIQDAVRRSVDLGQPVARFEQALALDPDNATANRRLGQIELSLGEYPAALAHLAAAYRAEPWSMTSRQLYGEALIANSHLAKGRALWATVRSAEGQLQIRAYWYGSIGDEERAAWMRQAAAGSGPNPVDSP